MWGLLYFETTSISLIRSIKKEILYLTPHSFSYSGCVDPIVPQDEEVTRSNIICSKSENTMQPTCRQSHPYNRCDDFFNDISSITNGFEHGKVDQKNAPVY